MIEICKVHGFCTVTVVVHSARSPNDDGGRAAIARACKGYSVMPLYDDKNSPKCRNYFRFPAIISLSL